MDNFRLSNSWWHHSMLRKCPKCSEQYKSCLSDEHTCNRHAQSTILHITHSRSGSICCYRPNSTTEHPSVRSKTSVSCPGRPTPNLLSTSSDKPAQCINTSDSTHMVISAENRNWRARERTEHLSIIPFSAHHSVVFYFRCSVYWWKRSVRF